MNRLHCFLIATLPELALNTPPPLSVAEFDALCANELNVSDFRKLCAFEWKVSPGEYGDGLTPVYAECAQFEEYMRNRIALKRAEKAGVALELPDPPYYYGMFDYRWPQLCSMRDPSEREKMLDALRWEFLDDLSCGHDLDFEFLCIYRLRLLIVNKYRLRAEAPGRKNFDAALEMLSPFDNKPQEE